MGAHPAPVVTTERLTLRGFEVTDFEAKHAMLMKPEVNRYLGPVMTRADHWRRVTSAVGQWVLLGHGMWMVERRSDRMLIGDVGLFEAMRGLGFDGKPEMGWIFDNEVHGQGYASEACNAALDWAETTLEPTPIYAIIEPGHEASFRLADKLRFKVVDEQKLDESTVSVLERPAW